MEQHPVPQNVTTFQFRLVGDMTIKQFGYLAAGAILAFVSYKLPLPLFFTWPLTSFFTFLGIGFAFVPIEERPMDVWVFSFLRSVYSPTQYVWQPRPVAHVQEPPKPPNGNGRKQAYPSPVSKEASLMSKLFDAFGMPARKPETSPRVLPTQQKQEVPSPAELAALAGRISQLQHEVETKHKTEDRLLELQSQLTALLADKKRLEDRLMSLGHAQSAQTSPLSKPAPTLPVNTPGATVKVIGPAQAPRIGIPKLTTVPNVPSGIIKDNQGNFLPGVIVTIRDAEGIPLRALKTNKLGQFAASTPLTNGTYTVEVEDPRARYVFDRAQIPLSGAVVPALEITAISQKEISRQKLAQQIFGDQNI